MDKDDKRINAALDMLVRYGGTDGDHHKAWVIDQTVRILTGCPFKDTGQGIDVTGESTEYKQLVANAKAGEDGPETYEWYEGIAP